MRYVKQLRFWLAKNALRLAVWAEPDVVKGTMANVFMEQMRSRGIVGIEFGFDDEGQPAMMLRKFSELPIVTRH